MQSNLFNNIFIFVILSSLFGCTANNTGTDTASDPIGSSHDSNHQDTSYSTDSQTVDSSTQVLDSDSRVIDSEVIDSEESGLCADFPAVKVKGDIIVLNEDAERRFFLAGLVDNRPSSGEQLSRYDHDEMETEIMFHKNNGATSIRWNAFLKGLDFTWDESGLVSGLKDGCLNALKDGLDLAQKHGILVQIVLSTAHFGKYGWGGADNELGGIQNGVRVANCMNMFNSEAGRQAYINNVLTPIINKIGLHPGLFGYAIVNEAYGMIHPDDTNDGSWSDEFVRLENMKVFVNKVAGEIHRGQPGAIVTVTGISKLKAWFDDAQLINAGADLDGTLDIHQYQYYPENHKESYSPFVNSPDNLIDLWGGESKPVIAGEFPVDGLEQTDRNPTPMTLLEAYNALWTLGYSGGYTWSNLIYANQTEQEKIATESAYQHIGTTLLQGIQIKDRVCN